MFPSQVIDQPLVSIGMPVFNSEEFLAQAIESILSQEYENFELLISDNASSDRSLEIIREYQARDPRIQFSVNETNIGGKNNAVKVLNLARGPYFMFAGSHDLWNPSFISACLEVLAREPEVALAYPQTLLIDIHDNIIELMNDRIDTRGLNTLERFRKIIWELGYVNMIYGVFRTDVLKKIDFSRTSVIGEDNTVVAEISLHGAIAQIPEPLYYRRKNIPGETPAQARKRQIAGMRKLGFYYEAVLPFTLLAYAHMEVIHDAPLEAPARNYLAADIVDCFFGKFHMNIVPEIEAFCSFLQIINVDALTPQEQLRLDRLVKAVKMFRGKAPAVGTFLHSNAGKTALLRRPRSDVEERADTTQPLISIVIPTYNQARYLGDAIHSALAQRYEHLEILIIDDGSRDNTREVVSSFSSEKIRYVPQEHAGAPATRNRGVGEAKGDFILWLDADDVLLPDTVTDYLALLKRFPQVDVLYGHLLVTDDTLKETGEIQYEDWFGRNPELLAKMVSGNALPTPGSMVRRACYQRVGLFDESFRRAHDYEWWTRLAPVANFKRAHAPVALWRRHNHSMSPGSVRGNLRYDARIVHLLVERYPLRELFPDLDFSQQTQHIAEALAYMQVGERLLQLHDLAGAVKFLKMSQERYPSDQNQALIQQLSKLAPPPPHGPAFFVSLGEC